MGGKTVEFHSLTKTILGYHEDALMFLDKQDAGYFVFHGKAYSRYSACGPTHGTNLLLGESQSQSTLRDYHELLVSGRQQGPDELVSVIKFDRCDSSCLRVPEQWKLDFLDDPSGRSHEHIHYLHQNPGKRRLP